ncbi:MAG: hypothetical protein NT055_08495 [Nitrospirae bacterium]|nr:hypothetical protein [Nitrospirota bacterium]
MADVFETGDFGRIEDFIALAKLGKKVEMTVELRKQLVAQKVHPGDTEEMKGEISMYLLIGDFTFNVGGHESLIVIRQKLIPDVKNVSKVYMFGSLEESLDASKVNKNIANERLKVDYQRLKIANITFKEKYF